MSEASIDLDAAHPVKQLRLVATKGGITLSKVVVSYRDGRTHIEERRINLLAGERTKPIDPREEASFADRVALIVDRGAKAAGVARLEVWGLAADERAPTVTQSDEVDSLNTQIAQQYRDGKYAEALPHAERLAEVAKRRFGEEHARYATALSWLTKLYLKLGKVAEAEPLARRALSIREAKLGAEHLDTASSLIELAEVFGYQNRLAEAAPLEQRAVEIREKTLGPKHPDTAQALRNLGGSYQVLGRFADAEALFKRALAICEEVLGPDHPDVATSLNDLAVLYDTQGRSSDAEPLYKRSLAIREKALGPVHPDVATSLSNLANLYYQQKRYAEAEPLWKRSLEIREKALGPDHADVATALNNLALLYQAQGRTPEAEPLHKRALVIREKALGPDHLDVGESLNNLALLYYAQNRYAEAEPLYTRSLAIREKALSPDHVDVGESLNNLANLYYAQQRYAEAEPLYTRSLAIKEKTLGPDHADVAAALNNLALLYQAQGRTAEAEPLHKRALAIREKALGPDHLDIGESLNTDHADVATNLNNLANLYAKQGRYAEAEPLFRRALSIQEKALGPDHPGVAMALHNLARVSFFLDRYAEAETLNTRSLAIYEKAFGPDHPAVGAMLNNLATLYRDEGRYAEAEPLFKRSLSISEKTHDPDVGVTFDNLAELYRAQGRYAEAEPLYRRALDSDEKSLGPDHPEVATVFNNLALLYCEQARFVEAEPLYKRALAIEEKARGPEHPEVATVLMDLAGVYEVQGRYAEAEPLYTRSLAIREKALGPDHPQVALSLYNLAVLYYDQTRYTEAEPLYKRALAIQEKALGPDHQFVGSTLNSLANVYQGQGRYADAEPLFQRALTIYEKALGPENAFVGTVLGNLAGLYRAQGRTAEAEPLYKRALTIAEKALGPDHPDVGTSLRGLELVYFWQSDWMRAYHFGRRSTDVTVRRTRRGMETVGLALTGTVESETVRQRGVFSDLVKIAHRLGQAEPERAPELSAAMFQTAQWAQGSAAAQSLAQMAARNAKGDDALGRLVRERQDLVGEWQGKDKVLIAAHSEPPDRRKPEAEMALSTRLTAIDARLAEIDVTLKKDFPDYAALASPEPLLIEDGQAQLRDGEALVFFLDTPEGRTMPEETFIWVVTKTDSRWVRIDLGTKALTEKIGALRCGLDSSNWIDSSNWLEMTDEQKIGKKEQLARRDRCRQLTGADVTAKAPLPFDLGKAHELYQALFGQIEDLIKDKHLLIVPSGPLTQLPFQVLVTEKPDVSIPANPADYGKAAWLMKSHAIAVLPSVASLKVLRAFAKESHAEKPFIGFGNPLLTGRSGMDKRAFAKQSCPREAPEPLPIEIAGLALPEAFSSLSRGGIGEVVALRRQPPLPETADELCAVAHELEASDSEVHLGSQATETEVKKLNTEGVLANARVVQFATHGLVAGETERMAKSLSEPALLLTPPETATEEDDGLLTASEVTQLKLDADWVVLSACNTAAGGEKGNAEALSGLARAFFYAGARALLVSHWYVDSKAAVKITTGAFAELKRNPSIGRAEALRRAMLAAMANTSRPTNWTPAAHPAVWAPFVVVGEGGEGR